MPQSERDIDQLDEELKSKSEIKREMLQLQDFANKLIKLSKHQRSKIPFNEQLQADLVLADKIHNKHEALRRHVRHMAKVLSETDLTDIHQALDVMANKHQQESSKFIKLEQLKNKLITEGATQVETLLAKYESMERQKLRQLVRQAEQEIKAEKIGKYNRNLLNYLKQHMV